MVLPQAQFLGSLFEFAAFIDEDAYRSPVTRQNQIDISVSIHIAEDGAVDQPDALQPLCILFVQLKLTRLVPVNARRGRLGIASRQRASANKQIQPTVTVDITQRQGTTAGRERRQSFSCGRALARPIIAQDRWRVGCRCFVIAERGKDGPLSWAGHETDNSREIIRGGCVQNR